MSTDLTLLPAANMKKWYILRALNCERSSTLFEEIQVLVRKNNADKLSDHFSPTNIGCYADDLRDDYGFPLRCLSVGQLMRFESHPDVQKSAINLAVWAYLKQLPSDRRVVLLWS